MKHTFTVLAALATLALLPTLAFGQKNFQPARVTTLAGDTLRGFIDYKGWDKNPHSIVFKPDLQAPSQTFRPLDIKGFRVSGEQYVGSAVMVDTSPTNLDALTVSPTPVLRTDTTFLRAVVTGSRSLYRYKVDGREYLYTEQQGKFDLLIFKRYKPSSMYTIVRTNNTYQEQLAKYLADCPAMETKSKLLLYTINNIQRLFEAYYACTSQPAVFRRKKVAYQAGVLLGTTRTTLQFESAYAYLIPSLNTLTTYGPTGGLYFYIPLPGNLGHFCITNDLIYTSFSSSSTRTDTFSPNNYSITSSNLSISYLKLNTQLRFTRPIGPGALFMNAGISNGIAVRHQNNHTVDYHFYSTQQITSGEIFPMEAYEPGFVAGIGGSLKRLSAEARYERSSGFLNLANISSRFQRYSLMLGFRLY